MIIEKQKISSRKEALSFGFFKKYKQIHGG